MQSDRFTPVAALTEVQDSNAADTNPVSDSESSPVSFEHCKPGRFDKLETSIGTWSPFDGTTIIDDQHGKTGTQCLRLAGGNKTSVVLDIAEDVDTSGELTFHAERWTSRSPFSFRIEKKAGGGWSEVFNGDEAVRVGRAFLSHVRVPLGDDRIEQLRFTVTSPPKTGILIDDIRLVPSRPQEIVSVDVVPMTLPALIGTDRSPLLKLKIETVGSQNPISLTKLHGKIEGLNYVESLSLSREAGPDICKLALPENTSSASWTPKPVDLVEGNNFLLLSCKLKGTANIDDRVGASVSEVTFSNGSKVDVDAASSVQRLGVAVRRGGEDDVDTYRIPGLATTSKGTLIGVYDVRHRSSGDLPGDIDVGMSRSTDGGRTWEPLKVIMDMGDDPKWNYDGVGDPAILVDGNTGTIWVAATWSHGNRSWRGSGPGLKPEETGQLMLTRSDDDGVSWSKPINITEQVKEPDWCFLLQGPGKGITMEDGTIVFAAQYQDPPEQERLPHSTIIYSDDHGESWQVGTGAFDDTTESQVIELEPGVLMLNCRYNLKPARVVMTTRDLGKTWQKHTTSERVLIEPGSCMGSLIDVDQEVGRDLGGWLLFSNPNSTRGRHHITIKASKDRGVTWPNEYQLLLDEGASAGYSCMSMIDESTVGILYEGSQAHMTFQRIPLRDLTKDSP